MDVPATLVLPPKPRWGQKRRLEFIDFRLQWEGGINRRELVKFFGISVPQASLDLAAYLRIAPANARYDRSNKIYVATPRFKPALSRGGAQAYLSELLAVGLGLLPKSLSLIGREPPHDVVSFPARSIPPDVLSRVTRSIREHGELRISYQSMSRPSLSSRWIAPHALAFDGSRWHVRAWCHARTDFRDFVLARIQDVRGERRSNIDHKNDKRWHSYASVILRPRGDLTPRQKRTVEREFGMRKGTLVARVREALVFYFIRQLHLDRHVVTPGSTHPIELVNHRDLEPLLIEATRK